MSNLTIRNYIAWLTLAPILVVAILLESLFLQERFSSLDQELKEHGKLLAGQLSTASEYGLFSGNRDFLQELVKGAMKQPDVQAVVILDKEYGVVVQAGKFSQGERYIPFAKHTGNERSLREEFLDNNDCLLVSYPVIPEPVALYGTNVENDTEPLGMVVIEMGTTRVAGIKSRMLWWTIASTLLFLIFTVFLIYLAGRNITIPITKLNEVVKDIGEGKLGSRTIFTGHIVEMRDLSVGINAMAEKIQKEAVRILQQKEDADRLAAIAFESHEGMMIVGDDMKIKRVNNAFTRITGYDEDEVMGGSPGLLASGHHDQTFYAAMWEGLNSNGIWQGEIWNRRKSGEIYPAWVSITSVTRQDGEVSYYVATYTDITERKAAENEIRNLAFYDALTQLPNRRMLIDRLAQTMAASKRSKRYGALIFLDLDNFKPINDQYGHEVGDKLLIEVAQRLTRCVRETDTVARFGGDEFVILLHELDTEKESSVRQVQLIAEKIRAILAEAYTLAVVDKHGETQSTITHQCTSSLGVKLFTGHEASVEEVIKYADMAMFMAKRSGRNAIHFHEEAK